MKKYFISLMTGLFVLGMSGMANAIIIDFEEINNSGSSYAYSGYSLDTQGFNFSNSFKIQSAILHWGKQSSYNADFGGVTYSHNYSGQTTTITQINGDAFSLNAFDIGDVYNSGVSQNFIFTGSLIGGSLLETTFTTDSSTGLETVSLNWDNLMSFSFMETSGRFLQTDNFVIGNSGQVPVPEPATMFLFGLGLLGLAGVNRMKK